MVGERGHEVIVPSRRERHGYQEVGANELKPLRDLGFAWIVAKSLLDDFVDLADVIRGQRVGEINFRLRDVPYGLHGALVWTFKALVPDVHPHRHHGTCRHRRCSGGSW